MPFLWLFKASSATVRAVSQVWANGIMVLMKYVVGLDYRVSGRENVPDGPCIIACNHQSLWETVALCAIFPDASIVAKKELQEAAVRRLVPRAISDDPGRQVGGPAGASADGR